MDSWILCGIVAVLVAAAVAGAAYSVLAHRRSAVAVRCPAHGELRRFLAASEEHHVVCGLGTAASCVCTPHRHVAMAAQQIAWGQGDRD